MDIVSGSVVHTRTCVCVRRKCMTGMCVFVSVVYDNIYSKFESGRICYDFMGLVVIFTTATTTKQHNNKKNIINNNMVLMSCLLPDLFYENFAVVVVAFVVQFKVKLNEHKNKSKIEKNI